MYYPPIARAKINLVVTIITGIMGSKERKINFVLRSVTVRRSMGRAVAAVKDTAHTNAARPVAVRKMKKDEILRVRKAALLVD